MRAHDARARGGVLSIREVDNLGLARDVMHVAAASIGMVQGSGLPRSEIARACWEFLKHEVRYYAEPMGAQICRFPWVTVAHRVADCKSQAIYTVAMCAASGCRVALRFAVLPGETEFGHVYAIVDGTVVDPQLNFGEEVSYIACTTVPLNYT